MLKIKFSAYKLLFLPLAFCFLTFISSLLPALNQFFAFSAEAEDYSLSPSEIEDRYYKAASLVNQGYSLKAITKWRAAHDRFLARIITIDTRH